MTTPHDPDYMAYRPARFGVAEWRARVDLAACYRLVAAHGWDDLIYTHISVRLPGRDDAFLINPFGLTFREVTASNLLVVDLHGRVIGDADHAANPTGFTIHGAIHRARSDAHCVIHLHTSAGVAVSALDCGLLPLSQHAMRFWRSIGYHDYAGLALGADEQQRLVADLGPHKAMMLRNHGTLTCGETVAEAFVLMHTLEKACTTQLMAMAASTALRIPSDEVLDHTLAQLLDDTVAEGEREWPALLRTLAAGDDSFMR